MIRFIRKITVVEWVVITFSVFLLGAFACDEVSARVAGRRGASDAKLDVASGVFAFQVGGKPRPWAERTAQIFKERYDAELVRAYGCCPSRAESSYTLRYNDVMASAMSRRINGFSFVDAYNETDVEAQSQWRNELGLD